MKTTFCGIQMQSPFILGSGPLSYGSQGMIHAHKAGFGAIVTKTIRDEAAVNHTPHMALNTESSMINNEKWSDYNPNRWIEKEIPEAKAAGVIVIASIGHTVEEVRHLIPLVDAAQADMFELVSYEQDNLIPMIKAARTLTDKPIIAKLSPNWVDPVTCALEAQSCGADAITAMDSLGPVLRIDIKTGKAVLGGPDGTGWLSGSSIKPLVVRYVAEIASRVSIPIIGLGGVMKAEDAVEMMMAGAQMVGMCTAALIKGVKHVGRISEATDRLIKDLGYASYEDICGIALSSLQNGVTKQTFAFHFDKDLCTACNRCVRLCPYESRSLKDKTMSVDMNTCRQCGLCFAVCPTGALKGVF